MMAWAMFRKAFDKDSKWEFCGITEHDEQATEFEEMNQEEHHVRVVPLED